MSQFYKQTSGGGGAGITQIDGDTGSITGSTVTIYADNSANAAGSSVLFANSGTVSRLELTDANSNTFIGSSAGNLANTAVQNSGYGIASLQSVTSAANNSACGAFSLPNCTTGQANCALGFECLDTTNTGSYNLGMGQYCGDNQNGNEDSTIMLNSYGIGGLSNALFIGNTTGTGTQDLNAAYIQGIYSNTQDPSGTIEVVTIDTTTGQLGVTATGVLSITGDTGTMSGPNLTIYANNSFNGSGASVLFTTSGITSTLDLTDQNQNTFLGHNSGVSGTAATNNTSVGVNNLLNVNSTATGNVMMGVNTGTNITFGYYNVGLSNALVALTTGIHNVGIGGFALQSAVADNYNVAIGQNALSNLNGGGGANVAIGQLAGSGLASGGGNVGIGAQVFANGGAFDNLTAIGNFAMTSAMSNSACTAIGNGALASSTNDIGVTAIGDSCLLALNGGSNDTFMGYNAGSALVTGSRCVGLGVNALSASINDSDNLAVGYNSLGSLNGGSQCTALGIFALENSNADSENVSVGYSSLRNLNGGQYNVSIGTNSGQAVVTGNYNLLGGYFTGASYNGSESSNVMLNSPGATGDNNCLRIGNGSGTGVQQLSTAYISGISQSTFSSGGSARPYLALVDTTDDQVVSQLPLGAVATTTAFGSMTIGTTLQNTAPYPILVSVYATVSAAFGGTIQVSVEASSTPNPATDATPSISTPGVFSFSFVVPSFYYAVVSTSGAVTVSSLVTLATQIG